MLLTLEGVDAGRTHRVLDGVDWRLRESELWAVVGPNGAGKSSLLDVLRGRMPVTRGTLRYGAGQRGRALAMEPWRQVRCVSFASQSGLLHGAAGYAQSRWHAGHDAAAGRGKDVLGAAWGAPECRRIVRALGLDRLLERRVTELSNGERRKLLLAKAAATGPVVLALDNPFNGLDRASRGTVSDALARLHAEGVTVLVSTPREDEIPDAVTHVLLLDRGRVAASGPRDVVLADRRFARLMRPRAEGSARASERTASDPRPAAAEPAPVVELRDVGLAYGSTRILHRIDWTVRRGERWALLGPNGAGKSALLSLILADNPQAYANHVSLFGRRRGSGDTIWEIRRKIGSVSPETHLYYGPHHRVLDVIGSGSDNSVGVRTRPSGPELRAAEACLASLGLEGREERRFGELSEGERQTVLIARALAKKPELLVLDEPCQGLDAHRKRRFLDVLEGELRTTDTTLIYVTHDLDEVPSGRDPRSPSS